MHLFRDSKMTIDWENGKIKINAPHLQQLLKATREKISYFETMNFNRIYRELNSEAYKLSKMAPSLPPGLMEMKEISNENIENHYVCL